MMDDATLAHVVMRANLAPSVHNTQPARWRRDGDALLIAADPAVRLAVGDPAGLDAGLSCGAAVEATVLALGAKGYGATVTDHWDDDDRHTWRGHRLAARLVLRDGPGDGSGDGLAAMLEKRFTWRNSFDAMVPNLFGWTRDDAVLVIDRPSRDWLAQRNDWASLAIMQGKPFRRELLAWMRLSQKHPRYAFDGLGREAMQMDANAARVAPWALGPFWGVLNMFGATKGLTAEMAATQSAPVIACFHRATGESPVTTGRAYLRMCLEAAHLGMAGWPMAALSDHPLTRQEVCARFGIGPDRCLVQVIRFGVATAPMPHRARRPLTEILL